MSNASKAAFDLRCADRRSRVAQVHDLRPWDPDLECRLPITPDECNTCERCEAVHPIVWTVDVIGLGVFKLGAGCAREALGLTAGMAKVATAREAVLAVVRYWIVDGVRMNHMFHESLMRERAGDAPHLSVETYARERARMTVHAKPHEHPTRTTTRRERAVRDMYCACDYVTYDARCALPAFWKRYT